MTKCRLNVHTMSRTRSERQIPPPSPQQAAPGDGSSSGLARVFSTDWFYGLLHLIMTETGFWDWTSNEACGRFLEVISEGHSEVILRLILRSI